MNTNPRTFNPWPAGIVAWMILFVTATASLVTFTTRHHADLVSPDYYEREIRFQDQLHRTERASSPEAQPTIAWNKSTRALLVTLPAAHRTANATGSITLYRPSAARLDRTYPLHPDPDGLQQIAGEDLKPGLWKVQLDWTAHDTRFSANASIIVSPASAAQAATPR